MHHLTYERLGREWDSDLEVLCSTCHRREHLEHPEQTSLGVYLKLASEAISAHPFSSIADLSEALKRRCVALKIAVRYDRIHAALAVVCGNRLKTEPPQTVEQVRAVQGRPLTKLEARDLWCRLGFEGSVKAMPAISWTPSEQRAHEEKIRTQVHAFRRLDVLAAKRRPLIDRLTDLFAGK